LLVVVGTAAAPAISDTGGAAETLNLQAVLSLVSALGE
jgi:hypothetical protein